MSSEYATLEEAFGVASFQAPQPLILRGDVGNVQAQRQKHFDEEVRATSSYAQPGRGAEPAPFLAAVTVPPRAPVEMSRKQIEKADACDGLQKLARAHAEGGAAAAWKLIPEGARSDMMWYAVRQVVDSDIVVMVCVAFVLYFLFR